MLGCVCARAQAAGGARRRRAGRPAGGKGRVAGAEPGAGLRDALGEQGQELRVQGRAANPARNAAPAPWTRTTATVSTARGPAGGRPLPRFLPSPARRPAAPLAARVSRGLWCRTRA